ncbi:hypothetical protein AMTRI_Chr04g183730 [Amborella trichopoda]
MEKFTYSVSFSEINKTFEYMLKGDSFDWRVKLEKAKKNKLLVDG